MTTTEVIGEVCHRSMLKEAMDSGLIITPAAASLKRKHDDIRELRKYWELTAWTFQWNLMVLGPDESRHHRAQRVRAEHGLLTNDSLIVAACLDDDIRSLATRDSDFDQIPGLTIYNPTHLT